MKKIWCYEKVLKYVLICPQWWKMKIRLKNSLKNPRKLHLKKKKIMPTSYSNYHILRKHRSLEFFIYASISCNICAKIASGTSFYNKTGCYSNSCRNCNFPPLLQKMSFFFFRKLFSSSLNCWFGLCTTCWSGNHET